MSETRSEASELWRRLDAHAERLRDTRMRTLFDREPDRLARCSAEAAGLYLDVSKNPIDAPAWSDLLALLEACGLPERRRAMFSGERINSTEGRAVWHVALRALEPPDEVARTLARMAELAEAIRDDTLRGATGEPIDDVIHVGIGGSHLGPELALHALAAEAHPRIAVHFLANIDGFSARRLTDRCSPARTLVIVASKTFTTLETAANATLLQEWLAGFDPDAPARQLVAVTANVEAARAMGIAESMILPFWDWVGGRYSLWSAIGLPVMIAIGADGFGRLLAGARAMDTHFLEAPAGRNLPVLLAAAGLWNRSVLGRGSLTVVPYEDRLALLPAYLQQLDMESNGKSVTHAGRPVERDTAPAVWGQQGTLGQHAYFQWLHQGTEIAAVDFIACAQASHGIDGHHRALLANCIAQAEALMLGRDRLRVEADLRERGMSESEAQAVAPHRSFAGDRPSNMILLGRLDAEHLGSLLALYEHKVFVQGVAWDINSFDQWGVELGKVLARRVVEELAGTATPAHDPSTNALIERVRAGGTPD
ncbi:MAG: glucose-6-phosphate isomerase [Burkholderiales bacterium]|nr:MAG: glucose-6-phosphate isomerase [Burkholderiales bacterium]